MLSSIDRQSLGKKSFSCLTLSGLPQRAALLRLVTIIAWMIYHYWGRYVSYSHFYVYSRRCGRAFYRQSGYRAGSRRSDFRLRQQSHRIGQDCRSKYDLPARRTIGRMECRRTTGRRRPSRSRGGARTRRSPGPSRSHWCAGPGGASRADRAAGPSRNGIGSERQRVRVRCIV